ncbi:bifunctional riboflavin kinase/FAD synthetase [Rhodomicrobium vannielii ATCC 17100]|uniref:bifunctional riboflavin kinase/FAD synthetase n=1 Tax=Rhodomicrobium vannielii TaxID=1069 RepID=UPI00191A2174|nr:bifunctional riboflavin kinase/FAD synthetase [Rhodomicrobium vannielii]MBJ7533818.1 bifunctional riboflavin kinase/FAD synthetase [Rhodomicrobium vannielii ATCC 17100]
MDVVHGWHEVPDSAKGASLAIGTFDGVHRGHRAVLHAAQEKAQEGRLPMGAMVFEPYPRKFFQPQKTLFRLTTLQRKLDLLAAYGCGFTAVIPFDADLAGLPADAFVEQILVDAFAIKHASVGYNFFFGKGRSGNPDVLAALGRQHGFGVTVVSAQGYAGDVFSSTRIRELLAEGDVAAAAEMLGSWWRIAGPVEGGAGRGKVLGYPTANIRLEDGVSLKHGIYAVNAYVDGRKVQGASYLGTRPTFDAGQPLLETFLFDFDGDLYGKTIEIEFIAYIRDDAKFKSAEALAQQMAIDVAKAKEILGRAGGSSPSAEGSESA